MRAVIFDFDYTLGDTTMGIADCINYGLAGLGLPTVDVERVRPAIGLTLPDTLKLLTGCEDPGRAGEFKRLFMERADLVMAPSATLYPDALPTLRLLRGRGIGTAVATTKASFRIEAIFKRFDALELLDVIVGCDDVKNEKPHPEALFTALRRLGAESSQVLYVGDSVVDAMCAQSAGVPFAGVTTGATPREALEAYPHLCVGGSLTEVMEEVLS